MQESDGPSRYTKSFSRTMHANAYLMAAYFHKIDRELGNGLASSVRRIGLHPFLANGEFGKVYQPKSPILSFHVRIPLPNHWCS